MSACSAEVLARHRRVALVALPPAVAALALADPRPALQLALLVPFVAVLGVPHGALDHRLAALLWPLEGPRAHAAFATAYLGLAGLVVGLWLAVPAVALALFLLYSALHFSEDWHGELPGPARALAGTAVVSGPAVLHEPEVAAIFAKLVPADGAALVAAGLGWAGTAALPALAIVVAPSVRSRSGPTLELLLIAGAALVLPPLVYFVVYFCGIHAPRHFLAASHALGLGPAGGAAAALPITLVTTAGAVAGGLLLGLLGTGPNAAILKAVFIGLAALTVPHMVLVDRLWSAVGPPPKPG